MDGWVDDRLIVFSTYKTYTSSPSQVLLERKRIVSSWLIFLTGTYLLHLRRSSTGDLYVMFYCSLYISKLHVVSLCLP